MLSLLMAASLMAQPKGKIKNGFNLDEFPEVSFVYHTNNPDALEKSDFAYLKESGDDVKINNIEILPVPKDSLPANIVVLWEDMNHYKGQSKVVKEILSGFFNSSKSSGDFFAVYAFNRRGNTDSALIPITKDFTRNTKGVIGNAIKSYKFSTESFSKYQNCSDMYTAIREGLELLDKKKGTKAIILFTAGHPMKTSGADSEAQVLLKAQQLHIPVYIFQNITDSGVTSITEGFANSSYGIIKTFTTKTTDTEKTIKVLQDVYSTIGKRYQGHDYKISFSSSAKRGSEARAIALSVGGVEITGQMMPPPHTFTSWVKDHLVWTILIVVILIAIVVAIIVYAIVTKKKQRRAMHEMETKHIQDVASIENRLEQTRKDAEAREQERIQKEDEIRRKAQEQAEQERLQQLMQAKNLYPRLKCTVGEVTFSQEIVSPVTRIGREANNDVVLNHSTVSRYHAEIVFNGSCFEIVDKESTNKVIVNGRFVERVALKSGDIIGLGQALVTFV